MAIIWTFVSMYLLVQSKGPNFVERFLGGSPIWLASVPISLGMVYGWTIIGLCVGIVYDLAGLGGDSVLGSPSAPMLYASAVASIVPLPFVTLTWPGRWWLWLILSGSFLGLWGWAMPIMAEH
jgi:hypothetical protein